MCVYNILKQLEGRTAVEGAAAEAQLLVDHARLARAGKGRGI